MATQLGTEKAQDIEEGMGFTESKRLPIVTPELHTMVSLNVYLFIYLLIHSFIHATAFLNGMTYVLGPYIFYLYPTPRQLTDIRL